MQRSQGSLTTLKDRLMYQFEKKVAEYETKVFQRDTGKLKFMSICLLDKDLTCATTDNEICQLHLQRDGLGI